MHDSSCSPRDDSLSNRHPTCFVVVRPGPCHRADNQQHDSNSDSLSASEHDHLSLVLMHTGPNPPPGHATRRAVWTGDGTDKSLAPIDCCTGQTAAHLRSLRHLLWFPSQIVPVPVPPITPTNLVVKIAETRNRPARSTMTQSAQAWSRPP